MSLFKAESKSDCIKRLMSENKQLETDIRILKDKLDKIQHDIDSTPEDCKRGMYCGACEFSKTYHVFDDNYCRSVIYVCGKSEACKNFVERKENNDA